MPMYLSMLWLYYYFNLRFFLFLLKLNCIEREKREREGESNFGVDGGIAIAIGAFFLGITNTFDDLPASCHCLTYLSIN